jgi:hypothetical protein
MTTYHEENLEVTIRDAESSINRAVHHYEKLESLSHLSVPPIKLPEDTSTCSTSSTCEDDYSCATAQIKNSMSFRSNNDADLHKVVSASRRVGKGRNRRSILFLWLRPPKARKAKRNSSSQDYPDFEDPPRLNLPQHSDTEDDLPRGGDELSVLELGGSHFAPVSLVESFIAVYYNRDVDLSVEDCHVDKTVVPSAMQSLVDERQSGEAVEMVLDSQRLEKVLRQVLLEPTGNFQLIHCGIAPTQ